MFSRLDPVQVYDALSYRYEFAFVILERINEQLGAYDAPASRRFLDQLLGREYRARPRHLSHALERLTDKGLVERTWARFDPRIDGIVAPHEQPRRAGPAPLIRRRPGAPLHLDPWTLENRVTHPALILNSKTFK